MLTFGSISPGAGSASKWIYNGGSAPDKIQTIPGVTGIKNPLSVNIDFKQWFAANELGFDYLGGHVFDDGNTFAGSLVVSFSGFWLVANSANDATLNQEAFNFVLSDRIISEVKDFNTGDELKINHEARFVILRDQSFNDLFRISNTGAIGTNQIGPTVGAPHHTYDMPIHDAQGVLQGYIRVYTT